MAKIIVSGKSDKGLVRTGNEDYLHIDEPNNVVAVCDGMGGHNAGEVASMTASVILEQVFNSYKKEISEAGELGVGKRLPENSDLLLKAVRLANHAIVYKAETNREYAGMGTTIVGVTFDDDLMSVIHVGDSRAYKVEPSKLIPLTTDHSWVAEIQKTQNLTEEEASEVVGKNIITRALGVKETVEVDCHLRRVKKGDKFLLCSDGLCGYADDDEIFETIRGIDDNDKIVNDLIQMANDRGGADNVTIAVVEIDSVKKSNLPEIDVFTLPEETEELSASQQSWVEKILDESKKKAQKESAEEVKSSKMPLIIIFVAFVIAAGLFLYFMK